jgi:protoporphyrinogen oxidase
LNEKIDSELLAIAKSRLWELALVDSTVIWELERCIRWPKVIPLPNSALSQVNRSIDRLEHDLPGFKMVGNYRLGVSVEECILAGKRAGLELACLDRAEMTQHQ